MEPVTPRAVAATPPGELALVVSLPELLVVQADAGVQTRLRVDPQALPTSLSMSIVASDWSHLRAEVVPQLLDGQTWSGRLQFRDPDGVERRLPTIVVPHLVVPHFVVPPAEQQARYATVLIDTQISGVSWAGAFDHLTGLPTRPVLLDRLEQALTRVERRSTEMAVLFIDLDGLKLINDRYGHETGDEFLIDTAARLKACLRTGDTVSRFGGDEFVILCEDLERRELAHQVAQRILDSLLRTDGKPAIGVSIGIAFAGDTDGDGPTSDGTALVARADAAMYRAKARGGRRAEVFDTEMQRRQDEDTALRNRLMLAVANNELAVAAQPIFELSTGTIRGVELFVRFAGDSMQPIGAVEVLRLAREQTEAIDTAVLNHAAALGRIWRRALGHKAPRVHINVSPQTLSSADLTQRLIATLDKHRLGPSALVVEIDETTILHADERHIATLLELRTAGVGVAIDGLAGGQLPLDLIAHVRPTLVKVEARRTAPDDQRDAAMLSARRLTPLGIAVSAKALELHSQVQDCVAGGLWAGQGTILRGVGAVEHVSEDLFASGRLGF